jgi:SIR2-like protein
VAVEIPTELVDRVARGECVLFVGAGFSKGVTGVDWDGLLQTLAKGLRAEERAGWDRFDPLTKAQLYVERHGRARLERALAKCLGVDRDLTPHVKSVQETLLGMPFRTIVTTNYDRLAEATLDKLGVPYGTIIDDVDVHLPLPPRARRVIKMHGDLDLSDTIILTRDDYLAYERTRPSVSLLLRSLLLEHSFLFYGFSLEDLNFAFVYDRVESLRGLVRAGAQSYAVLAKPNPLLQKYWANHGLHVLAVDSHDDAAKLVGVLREQVDAHIRSERQLARVAARLGKAVAERTDELTEHLRQTVRSEVARLARSEVDLDVERRRELGSRAEAALVLIRRLDELALDVEPQDLAVLGARLFEAHRWREATEALESARFGFRRLGLDSPLDVRQRLGRCYARLGSWPHAFRILKDTFKASQLWGDLSWCTAAANEIARALLARGRKAAARRLLTAHTDEHSKTWPTLLGASPPDERIVRAYVMAHFARSQRLLDRDDLANRYAKRALELLPGLREARELCEELDRRAAQRKRKQP